MSFDQFIGRQETQEEVFESGPLKGFRALFNEADKAVGPKCELPPTGHWLYFVPRVPQADIKEDGHPKLGAFLPPITLPRRMWAGSEITYQIPLKVGDSITKKSVIHDIVRKSGSTGDLLFVTIENSYEVDGKVALIERQNLVYRDDPNKRSHSSNRRLVSGIPDWTQEHSTDPVMLFRYSALTFNSHRIHYDFNYAVNKEGYPDLIVHGQLLATFMIDVLQKNIEKRSIKAFSFRGHSAAIVGESLSVCAKKDGEDKASLWIESNKRGLIMTGEAQLC